MGVSHSMNHAQVDQVLSQFERTTEAIQGIDQKAERVHNYVTEVKTQREHLSNQAEAAGQVVDNLAESLNDRSDDVLDYFQSTLDAFAGPVEELEWMFIDLRLQDAPKQIRREFGPLLVPAVVLVMVLTVSNSVFGFILASDQKLATIFSIEKLTGMAQNQQTEEINVLQLFAFFHVACLGFAVLYLGSEACRRGLRRRRNRKAKGKKMTFVDSVYSDWVAFDDPESPAGFANGAVDHRLSNTRPRATEGLVRKMSPSGVIACCSKHQSNDDSGSSGVEGEQSQTQVASQRILSGVHGSRSLQGRPSLRRRMLGPGDGAPTAAAAAPGPGHHLRSDAALNAGQLSCFASDQVSVEASYPHVGGESSLEVAAWFGAGHGGGGGLGMGVGGRGQEQPDIPREASAASIPRAMWDPAAASSSSPPQPGRINREDSLAPSIAPSSTVPSEAQARAPNAGQERGPGVHARLQGEEGLAGDEADDWEPRAGQAVTASGSHRIVARDYQGNRRAWVLPVGAAAKVIEVDAEGDVRLVNEHGVESGWVRRRAFRLEEDRSFATDQLRFVPGVTARDPNSLIADNSSDRMTQRQTGHSSAGGSLYSRRRPSSDRRPAPRGAVINRHDIDSGDGSASTPISHMLRRLQEAASSSRPKAHNLVGTLQHGGGRRRAHSGESHGGGSRQHSPQSSVRSALRPASGVAVVDDGRIAVGPVSTGSPCSSRGLRGSQTA